MIYKGFFRDIHNRLRELRFTTPGKTGVQELTLGGSPFVTSMRQGKSLYAPALYEAATAQIITDEYLFDLYSGSAQGVKVELLDEAGGALWVGYAEPTMYNQGFRSARELVNIDCASALASLQHIKHSATAKNATVSLAELLMRTLGRCNAYTSLYVPTNIEVPDAATADPLSSMVISEENFFAEQKDVKETDEDLAWSCREVLEEICSYLGVTATAYGKDVFLLDYDAIRAGDTEFWHYDIAAGRCLGKILMPDIAVIRNLATMAPSGAKLSLEKVYNKIEVSDSFYPMEDLTVDPFNILETANITADTDILGTDAGHSLASMDDKQGALLDCRPMRLLSDEQEPSNVIRLFDSVYKVKSDEWGTINLVVARYITNPRVKLYRYSVSQTGVPTKAATPISLSYSATKKYTGALLSRFFVQNLPCRLVQSHSLSYWTDKRVAEMMTGDDRYLLAQAPDPNMTGFSQYVYDWHPPLQWHTDLQMRGYAEGLADLHAAAASRFGVSSITPSPYICLFNPARPHIAPDNDEYDRLPFFSVEPQNVRGGLIGGDDTFIIISGKLSWHYDQDNVENGDNPYPVPSGQIDPIGRKKKTDRDQMYIKADECWTYAFLQHDGRSWDGSKWVDDPEGNVRFKLWYLPADADNDARKVTSCISTDMEIRNSVDYTMGLGSVSGTAIPLPLEGQLLEQTPRFGLCKPHDPKMWYPDNEGPHFYTFDRVFVKDLKMEVAVAGALTRDVDSDTIYANVIDDSNVVKASALKLKITTYDSKKFSYSNVGLRTPSGTRFLARFVNRALHDRENTWEFDNGEYANAVDGLCAEEHLVFKLTEQYSRPAAALSLTVNGANLHVAGRFCSPALGVSRILVPTMICRDYRHDTVNVKLTEKF